MLDPPWRWHAPRCPLLHVVGTAKYDNHSPGSGEQCALTPKSRGVWVLTSILGDGLALRLLIVTHNVQLTTAMPFRRDSTRRLHKVALGAAPGSRCTGSTHAHITEECLMANPSSEAADPPENSESIGELWAGALTSDAWC